MKSISEQYKNIKLALQREISEADRIGAKFVIVYQMGKVASTSYQKSLEKCAGIKVFHAHRLSEPANQRFLKAFAEQRDLAGVARELKYICIREELLDKGRKVALLCGVRDPVGRNLSAYFQNLPLQHIEDWDLLKIIDHFKATYPHRLPLEWFSDEFYPAVGVSVYEHPFDKLRGSERVGNEDIECLILSAESTFEVKIEEIMAFLNLPHFDLDLANSAES